MRKNAKNCCFLNDFFHLLYTEKPYLCTRMCVLRQNEVRYWLYLIDFCRTSKEMVADPLHSACRC